MRQQQPKFKCALFYATKKIIFFITGLRCHFCFFLPTHKEKIFKFKVFFIFCNNLQLQQRSWCLGGLLAVLCLNTLSSHESPRTSITSFPQEWHPLFSSCSRYICARMEDSRISSSLELVHPRVENFHSFFAFLNPYLPNSRPGFFLSIKSEIVYFFQLVLSFSQNFYLFL